jgi:hypothetical protein
MDLSAILAGELDDQLLDINKAVIQRASHADVGWRWKVEWGSYLVTEDDLTVDEAALLEQATGKPWGETRPTDSVHDVRAVLAVVMVTRHSMTPEDAATELRSLAAHEALNVVTRYQVSPRPLRFETATEYVRHFGRTACWPPSVVRKERVGDLGQLIDRPDFNEDGV